MMPESRQSRRSRLLRLRDALRLSVQLVNQSVAPSREVSEPARHPTAPATSPQPTVTVPLAYLRDRRLWGATLAVYGALVELAGADGGWTGMQRHLAQRADVSHRAASRAVAVLEQAGAIEVVPSVAGRINHYRIRQREKPQADGDEVSFFDPLTGTDGRYVKSQWCNARTGVWGGVA